MQTHKIVSRDEWNRRPPRAACQGKEMLRATDALKRQARELPWVKVRQELCVRRSERQGDARRLVRRPQPARRQTFHDGARLGRRLPRLFVRGRPDRRLGSAPRQPRRHVRRHLARALPRDRDLSQTDGLEVQVGVVERFGFQLRLQRLLQRGRQGARQGVLQLRGDGLRDRRTAGLFGFLQGRGRRHFPQPTRCLPVAPSNWPASTASST